MLFGRRNSFLYYENCVINRIINIMNQDILFLIIDELYKKLPDCSCNQGDDMRIQSH